MRTHSLARELAICFFFLLSPSLSYGLTVNVSVQDFFFSPTLLSINVGDTVVWTNNGAYQHTSTSGSGCIADGKWNSGTLSPGQSFSFIFNTAGTYPYFCNFHCLNFGMTGTVVVNALTSAMLTVSKSGTGNVTVTSSPAVINCGTACSATFALGTAVTLTETPDAGTTFTGWSGACSSQSASAACVVTMNAAKAATAHYLITGTTSFSDVPSGSTFASYIEAIYNNRITVSCGNGNYCPANNVTRDQMAAFLVRATQVAAGQGTENFTCNGGVAGAMVDCAMTTPYFLDVPSTNAFFKYIQKLKELGITIGCGNGDYCPSQDVTREQMAAFLARAFLGMK